MTRGRPTELVVCQDTTASVPASAPNCRCSPDTGAAALRSGRCQAGPLVAQAASPGTPSATAPPSPAAAPSAPRRLKRGPDRASLSGLIVTGSSTPPVNATRTAGKQRPKGPVSGIGRYSDQYHSRVVTCGDGDGGGGGADDELGGQPLGGRFLASDELGEQGQPAPAHLVHRGPDGGQRDGQLAGQWGVVVADQRQVAGHLQAAVAGRAERPDGGEVVHRADRRRWLGRPEQRLRRSPPAARVK